jgi:hypothetical protein
MMPQIVMYAVSVCGLSLVGLYMAARISWSLWEELLEVLRGISLPEKETPVGHARALYSHFRWQSPPDEEGMMLVEAIVRRLSIVKKKRTRKPKQDLSTNG